MACGVGSGTLCLDFTGMDLGSLGTSLGGLLTNLAEPLFSFMIYMTIVGGVTVIIGAIVLVITQTISSKR